MSLLLLLLALAVEPDRPVTLTGRVAINYQLGGKPSEYLFPTLLPAHGSEQLRQTLAFENDYNEQGVADSISFDIPVTITGILVEKHSRFYIIVHKVSTVESKVE